ncbi:MAG: hypothetical protein AAGU27_15490 [Dehalobacterium sp.]
MQKAGYIEEVILRGSFEDVVWKDSINGLSPVLFVKNPWVEKQKNDVPFAVHIFSASA